MKISIGRMFLITFWMALAILILWPILSSPWFYETAFPWVFFLFNLDFTNSAQPYAVADVFAALLGLVVLAAQILVSVLAFFAINLRLYELTELK
jgi:hypothetical protein